MSLKAGESAVSHYAKDALNNKKTCRNKGVEYHNEYLMKISVLFVVYSYLETYSLFILILKLLERSFYLIKRNE